jgi:hypothetical protein
MKKFVTVLLILSIFTPLPIFAQNLNPAHACGTSHKDLEAGYQTMLENRARYGSNVQMRMVTYIPVALHLVAKSDGTGRVPDARILDYMATVNETYAKNGLILQFCIKYINYVNNDDFYSTPSSFASRNRTVTLKKRDALNIFFCNDLGDGTDPNSVRLGYYLETYTNTRYEADWIFVKNSEVLNGTSSTLEHELGHFFTLPHTFRGWECGAFQPTVASPCAPRTVACSGVAVENEARTGVDANCSTTGDGFCDTPADYNLGFGWSDCDYKGVAKDPKCVSVNPDEANIMGYFIANCAKTFSTQQKNAMQSDFLNNPARKYLRDNSTTNPSLVEMTAPTLQVPANNTTTNAFTGIFFDWSDVSGVIAFEPNNASGYLFEIGTLASLTNNYSFRVPSSNFTLNSSMLPANYLVPNKRYYWRVRPYSPCKTAFNYVAASSFFTGTVNSTNEIQGVGNFDVLPNPVGDAKMISINLTSRKTLDAVVKINNIAGQVVLSQKMRFETGVNTKPLTINQLGKGLYIVTIEAENGVLNKKLVVAE